MHFVPFFAVGLAALCQFCDEFDINPYANSPFGVPACSTPNDTLSSDPWPKAGETRRDELWRDCVEVDLRRAYVGAEDGFAPGELFALMRATSKRGGKVLKTASQREFIGTRGGRSYRYALSLDANGAVSRVAGSVESRRVSSRFIVALLSPQARPADSVIQNVECDRTARSCEVWETAESGQTRRFFVVRIDAAHPEGNVCVDIPLGDPALAVDIHADDVRVVAGLKAAGESGSACLGTASTAVLAKFARAERLSYQILRAKGEQPGRADRIEVDVDGLTDGIALARYLFENEIQAVPRLTRAQRLERVVEKMLPES